jgi:hypothetical protein
VRAWAARSVKRLRLHDARVQVGCGRRKSRFHRTEEKRRDSSSASDDDVDGSRGAQDRAPQPWTSERAHTLFVCEEGRKAAAS